MTPGREHVVPDHDRVMVGLRRVLMLRTQAMVEEQSFLIASDSGRTSSRCRHVAHGRADLSVNLRVRGTCRPADTGRRGTVEDYWGPHERAAQVRSTWAALKLPPTESDDFEAQPPAVSVELITTSPTTWKSSVQ